MDRRTFTAICLFAAGDLLLPRRARGEDVEPALPSTGHFNAVMPTLGGKQFWADELFFHDWHIQRNVLTGHCRLLDGSNLRHAWGTFDECRNKLDEIKRRRNLPPMQGPAVIVLHGLFRTASAMNDISRYLSDQGGYTVFNVNYASTRASVAEHARSLERIIDHLDGIDEINFVGHSLGNLVVRHYLADRAQEESGQRPDERIKRMVMLGPPNQGAELAQALGRFGLFHTVLGESATQLGREWDELETHLATPACEFGILAGGRGAGKGFNPWLDGDNDLIVSVETTRLAGAGDFAVLPVTHTFMMDNQTVQEYTLRFLKHGYFVSPEARQPIVAADEEQIARRPAKVEPGKKRDGR